MIVDNSFSAAIGIRAPAAATAGSTQLDQAAFLRLMTAQLRNQDPFKPVENEAMVAQMAQFSSVAGISEMNTTLRSIATRLGGDEASALDLVGRAVLVPGATAHANTDGTLAAQAVLTAHADAVAVAITGPDGRLLRTLDFGARPAGTLDIAWDGLTDAGEAAGPGPFTLTAHARAGGQTRDVATNIWAAVRSVALTDGRASALMVDGIGRLPLTAILAAA